MKLFLPIVIFLSLFVSPLAAQQDAHFDHPGCKTHEIEKRRVEAFAKRAQLVPIAAEDYDVHYYRLDITFPSDGTLPFHGSVYMEVRSLIDDLGSITYNLGGSGDIDSIVVAGERIPTSSITRTQDVVKVQLPSALQRQEILGLTTYYRHPYGGSAVTMKSVQNVDLGKQILSIASQAEPYDARYWWPCKDDPADKADSVDIIFTVDEPLYPVSQGVVLSDISNGDGTRTVHWQSHYPIVTYLVSIAAAEYNYKAYEFTHSGKTMPVGNWWYGHPADNAEGYAQDMLSGLQVLSDLFIPYPYMNEKYGMAEYEWGGAMEHQTVSSMGFYNTDVVIHELMHQWFGDKVTCATFEHIWLNEGWATYGEALFRESRGGLPALKAMMATAAYYGPGTIFVNNPKQNTGSIFSGNLSYNKASWVVHMLRHVVGDEDFFAATKKYLGGDGNENYRSVTTDEFQQYYEDESGMDLDAFFQQWIYGEYYPTYQFEWGSTENGGMYDVTVDIQQLYIPDRQLFTMPIDLYFAFSDGSDTTIVVQNDEENEQYSFSFPAKPELVKLDPDAWILKRVIETVKNPTFDRGVLVVNGIDWDVEAYTQDLQTMFSDSTISGGMPYTLWDLFPNPSAAYPSSVPEPIGSGAVPANVLGQFCTVVWLGNAYNGDDAAWANTSIYEYIKAGGNVLLISRMGRNFISEDMRQLLGFTWSGNYATAENCQADIASLFSMDFTGQQSLVNVFDTDLEPEDNVLLFSETQSFAEPRGLGVWGKPITTEIGESGHMMFVGLRPYRVNPEYLKPNIKTLLGLLPCVPVTSVDDPAAAPAGISLQQSYPNPVASGSEALLRFSIGRSLSEPLTVRVYDMLGKLVREVSTGIQNNGVHAVSISTDGLPTGVYTYALQSGTVSVSRTMIVMD